jgi:hypothetical protein
VATVARGFGPYMENPIIERMFKHMVWAIIAGRAGLEVFSAVCLYVGLRRGGGQWEWESYRGARCNGRRICPTKHERRLVGNDCAYRALNFS